MLAVSPYPMIDHANVDASHVNIFAKTGVSAAHFPAQTHPTSPNTPITVTQAVLAPPAPLIPNPIASAKGIVNTMVNSPHGLSAKALTTTKANTAIRIVIIPNKPITASVPATGPTSSRSICPTDFPPLRTLSHNVILS